MLVLSRRVNERIVIGNGIVVTVLEVKGDQIRLGIDAPRDVQVHREEVLAALSQANQDSVLGSVPAALPLPRPARQASARRAQSRSRVA